MPLHLKKQPVAAGWLEVLWEQHQGRLSYQVLGEHYVTVTRKPRPGLDRETAQADIRDLMAWRPVRVDGLTVVNPFLTRPEELSRD